MHKRIVRRVERLEVATCAVDVPHVEVIHLDEHGRLTRSVPTRPDGLPIPVIILPTLRTQPWRISRSWPHPRNCANEASSRR